MKVSCAVFKNILITYLFLIWSLINPGTMMKSVLVQSFHGLEEKTTIVPISSLALIYLDMDLSYFFDSYDSISSFDEFFGCLSHHVHTSLSPD